MAVTWIKLVFQWENIHGPWSLLCYYHMQQGCPSMQAGWHEGWRCWGRSDRLACCGSLYCYIEPGHKERSVSCWSYLWNLKLTAWCSSYLSWSANCYLANHGGNLSPKGCWDWFLDVSDRDTTIPIIKVNSSNKLPQQILYYSLSCHLRLYCFNTFFACQIQVYESKCQ